MKKNTENTKSSISLLNLGLYLQRTGIIANGISSSLMIANANSNGKNLDLHGWIPYSVSVGSALVGSGIISTGDLNDTKILIALPFIVNSLVFQYISWGKFSGNADRAKETMSFSNVNYNFVPIAFGDKILPGLLVSGTF